ncbi:MAG: antitoxin Xre/MbcA/ParS toxin-binding domain-containing protein [Saprospiraceae bacterium]
MITQKKGKQDNFEVLKNILGRKYIGSTIESQFDFITIASKGVNANVILNFRDHFNIDRNYIADLLNISAPTIYRWIKENKKLEKNYSIQLFELTLLFLIGSEVFQGQDNFFKWLNLPNIALGGMEPKGLLEIPNGISKVRELLGRIEHGVYS